MLLKGELISGGFNIEREIEFQNILTSLFVIMKAENNADGFFSFKGIK